MKSISKGTIAHRTKLMEQDQAERFAQCLLANTRFESVSVETSPTAKSERRFFVRYSPTSNLCQANLIREEMAARAQRAQDEQDHYLFVRDDSGRYFHTLNMLSGEVYETCHNSCSCADFHYRGSVVGFCKHIRILRSGNAQIRRWGQDSPQVPQVRAEDVLPRREQAERDRVALWD